ncbi:MAG TPA: hypothetical protein VM490_12495, partial [Armatimonadaceae bacterium]|nr:hypothetical protein [Armatimonadaceae bacterium]
MARVSSGSVSRSTSAIVAAMTLTAAGLGIGLGGGRRVVANPTPPASAPQFLRREGQQGKGKA